MKKVMILLTLAMASSVWATDDTRRSDQEAQYTELEGVVVTAAYLSGGGGGNFYIPPMGRGTAVSAGTSTGGTGSSSGRGSSGGSSSSASDDRAAPVAESKFCRRGQFFQTYGKRFVVSQCFDHWSIVDQTSTLSTFAPTWLTSPNYPYFPHGDVVTRQPFACYDGNTGLPVSAGVVEVTHHDEPVPQSARPCLNHGIPDVKA